VTEFEKIQLANSAEWFDKTGELHEELLLVLWDALGLPVRRDDYAQMITMLSASGLIYLADKGHSGRKWIVPMRLPAVKVSEAKAEWQSALDTCTVEGKASTAECLSIVMSLGKLQPANVVDCVVSACGGLGVWVEVWKTSELAGAFMKPKFLRGVSHLLVEVREVTKEDARPEFELFFESVGPKSARLEAWASLMHVKRLAQNVVDRIPGLATFCKFSCPSCFSTRDPEPFMWSLDDVAAKAKQCEKCSEHLTLNAASLAAPITPTLLYLDKAPNSAPRETRYCAEKLRFGRPLESVCSLPSLLGLASAEDVDRLRSANVDGIIAELIARPDPPRPDEPDNKVGWSSLEWLKYLAGETAEMAIQASQVAQGMKSSHTPEEGGAAKAAAESQERLRRQAKEAGIDAGRENIDLSVFVKMPICQAAGLHRGHILALRLYTARMAHSVNMSLHDGCSPERPHPYPTLVILLNEAIWKLRAAQVEQRKTLQKKVVTLLETAKTAKEDGDDEKVAVCTQEAKETEAFIKTLECYTFHSGVANLSHTDFKMRGATEVGFFSVNKAKKPAQERAFQVHRKQHAADDDDEEREYLALAPGWKPSGAVQALPALPERPASPDLGDDRAVKRMTEIPVLLVTLVVPNDNAVPASVSFLSVYPDDSECVYPPGTFIEQTKVLATEYMDGDVQYRTVEVLPTLGRNLGTKGKQKEEM